MNRRNFFKMAGAGLAVAVVAPATLFAEGPACVAAPKAYSTYVMGQNAFISQYADYANFSDFAISAAIDESVSDAAKELGEAHGRRVDYLYKTVAFGRQS
jgi:hypothetical protein